MTYRLGYIPSAQPATFRLRRYQPDLPVPPDAFGGYPLVKDWHMYANDRIGLCVLAGAGHEHDLWTREGAAPDCDFTDDDIIAAYSAITGYNPDDPSTDRGTDMERAARYRRRHGITDAAGAHHKIAAYLSVTARDVPVAAWLYGAVGIGVNFPGVWMDDFEAGRPWDVTNSAVEGGHYVPVVGRAPNGNLVVVTWGRTQQITSAALDHYLMEALVYLTPERMTAGKSPEGFDLATLEHDLAQL